MKHRSPFLLLVEDSDTQALHFRLLLEREGFRVDRTSTAEAALERLNSELPDVLIVDYRLPGMNGDELARLVRLNSRTRTLPIVMLTEASAPDVERQGLDSGANAYVPKSADTALLLTRLKTLLRQRRAERDSSEPTDFRRARILVVEPGRTSRLMMVGLLEGQGYEVQATESETALRDVDADCVIVALDSDAAAATGSLRRLDALRSAGGNNFDIVGLGGNEIRGLTITAGLAAGADDIVPRTVERDVLLARIRAVVRRKLARDEELRVLERERERDSALAVARAEAASAAALASANQDLAAANARLRDTQSQLVQSAKMASLGELVAGIAHEINNPLAFILAHQQTVERLVLEAARLCPPEAAGKLERAGNRLEAMRGGLVRIRDMVIKLRRFSRLDEGDAGRINVPEAIGAVLTLLGPKLGNNIRIETNYAAPAIWMGSPALINQVVMNILSNAADALGGNGRIDISTRLDGDRYIIEIGDDGPGIPPGQRERIFEPFFTTKEVGAGTGLGLSIAYGVVQAQGGTIMVGDSPTGGALFTLVMPWTSA